MVEKRVALTAARKVGRTVALLAVMKVGRRAAYLADPTAALWVAS